LKVNIDGRTYRAYEKEKEIGKTKKGKENMQDAKP